MLFTGPNFAFPGTNINTNEKSILRLLLLKQNNQHVQHCSLSPITKGATPGNLLQIAFDTPSSRSGKKHHILMGKLRSPDCYCSSKYYIHLHVLYLHTVTYFPFMNLLRHFYALDRLFNFEYTCNLFGCGRGGRSKGAVHFKVRLRAAAICFEDSSDFMQ